MQTDLPGNRLPAGPPPSTSLRLTAVEPVDLVSYIQHTLGFVPRNSITAIALVGRDLGAVLRCDWDPRLTDDGNALAGYARQVAGHLTADERADGSLVFLFRDPPGRPGPDDDSARVLAAALEIELAAVGLPVQEAWLVSHGRLWHLDCPDPAACTAHGSAVARTETSALNAAFIMEGSVVEDEPQAGGLPAPADSMSPALRQAVRRICGATDPSGGHAGWLRDWEQVLSGAGLPDDPATRAGLLGGLADVNLRDTLVAAASFTLPRAVSGAAWLHAVPHEVAEILGTSPREIDGVLYSSVLMATSRRAPDWDRIARLRAACEQLLSEAAGEPAAAVRCLVAWVEWARGRGSVAGRIIEECRRSDPDYPLAQVLGEVIDRGILSGWARRRSTAWSATRRGRP
ncbi:DUF4192 family protein [Micrococcus sp. TA1]|uniref:DUF4192 family protein n=2 Tax=Micrococcaceae TaxID=1268 RepID=UPI001612EFCC|nr:DUF4192 family protein [Micrococcus sp. TA1]MBB5749157.1 hypothetical protein [Micrococcus sp. TA1]